MRIRGALLVATTCLLVAAPAARAADARVIAPGVTVRGLDVSGRTVDDAAAYLGGYLTGFLSRDVVVQVGGAGYRLDAKHAQLRFDWLLTAKRAFYAGQRRPDQSTPVDVAPVIIHSRKAVRAWAAGIERRVRRPARNA